MYFFLILFFVSLVGIIAMISMKLALIEHKTHHLEHQGGLLADVVDFETIKHKSVKNFKKAVRISLWVILRAYIISADVAKKKKKEIYEKIKEKIRPYRKADGANVETQKEPSKYLTTISEYREKIKRMKRKIKEEEGIN